MKQLPFYEYAKRKNIPESLNAEMQEALHIAAMFYVHHQHKTKLTKKQAIERFNLSENKFDWFNRVINQVIGQYPFKRRVLSRNPKVKPKQSIKLNTVSPTEYAKMLGVEVGKEWTPSHSYWNDL